MTRPKIVCLCGSTRFGREFERQNQRLTMEGTIVLSIGCTNRIDSALYAGCTITEWEAIKLKLDALHLAKIELADEILVLNVGGYVGESTLREIGHAICHGKTVTYLEPDKAPTVQS